ncbi:MAG TPA: PIG-L family deacetylase [Kiritimatiellia bacterium]|nr:PIG-L family deacetylase [Kiritimatiellia bacterium]HRZ13028.1 PIG-L family deacetylase [Kiritimatiellia bacterium]HSA18362.1 PIG-L family deacetylase [Kiritimatiellia bacterium]
MKFSQPQASLLVPDGRPADQALAGISHLGIGAHPDDAEIIALHGILACRETRGFGAVICAHGGERVRDVRRREQEEAARMGRYGILAMLDHRSADLKGPAVSALEADIQALFGAARPETVYTHHPADRHETHVAVSLAVVRALRRLPPDRRPKSLYGVEVWGSLDWLPAEGRIELNVSSGGTLAAELIRVFRSQIEGGKRYDAAAAGRRAANATFADPYAPDRARELCLAMDLTPLLRDPGLDAGRYVARLLDSFRREALDRVRRVSGPGE